MVDFVARGELKGHNGWVTAVATTRENPNLLVSSSRDKTIMVWQLQNDPEKPNSVGFAKKALTGHSHFVQDISISSDGQFALSGSWDGTLRLWDLVMGTTTRRFVGHKKDVLSVAFSVDNRQIVSGSRDRTIKLWNTLAECKFTITEDAHTDWVSCVRFTPHVTTPTVVSSGCDKRVKIWNFQTCKMRSELPGHTAYVNTVAISPDGSICASGGKDGKAMIWDISKGTALYSLEMGEEIFAFCFAPMHYWLCAATQSAVKIWDLEHKKLIKELRPPEFASLGKRSTAPSCISLAFSTDGNTLFGGYTDNVIRVWTVVTAADAPFAE